MLILKPKNQKTKKNYKNTKTQPSLSLEKAEEKRERETESSG